MARQSPIADMIARAHARLGAWGPPDAGVPIVETFGEVPLEYAAARKACALMDEPQRAVLEVTGPDRLDFLNRMVTQELKGVEPFTVRRSFWLNRKGRIDADLRLINLPERVLVDVDTFAAERTEQGLGAYIITEDCAVRNLGETRHRLSLHGPGAAAVLAAYSRPGAGETVTQLAPDRAAVVEIADADVVVFREDVTGDPGYHLVVETARAARVYETLLQAAHEQAPGHRGPNARPLLRPIGWQAFNIARIEAGTALYYVDFGPDSLPAETGVLNDRVSFKKGCYLGQEIVARMHALGAPKQTLVSVQLNDPQASSDPDGLARLPGAGAPVYASPDGGDVIGAVTSSTLAPMLSRSPIALAMVKFKFAAAGTKVWAAVEGGVLEGTVGDGLAVWKGSRTTP